MDQKVPIMTIDKSTLLMAQYHRPINMSSPLDNEVHNLAQLVTKLADVMLSTNQHNRGLADQYKLGSSDQIIMEDHQFNGRSPDQYTHGRSPEQYNRGRSPDRNTPKLNAYRSATPPLS